ncbi:MAG: sulfatase-like hydrolase/transferase [Bacillota bacterium]|nr:sulfatase-like hydrolase/transferase [Bacillota bacterium]
MPAERFRGKSGTNEYGDFVLACDELVGRITDTLKEHDLYENTIVIFTSDNGCSPRADFAELSRYGHTPSYVFRGHKADIYEGGHRIPLLVQWPHKIEPGQICSALVSLVDFFATVAQIIGVRQPEQFAEDSISQLPLWLGESCDYKRTSLVHQSIDGSLSLRRGDYKLNMCPGSGGWSWPQPDVVIDGAPDLQLYRLSDDIGETKNLADEKTDIVASMRSELAQIVLNGCSTPGIACSNQGEAVWDSIAWLNDI